MPDTGVEGYASQLGMDSVAAVGTLYPFQSCDGGVDEMLIDANGIRGTRERSVERVRSGNRHVAYSIVLEPTALELSKLLPYCLGSAFALTDTLPTFFVVVDKVSHVMTNGLCVVNKAVISGREGEPLRLTLDIHGQDETIGNAGSFPSLSSDTTTFPLIFTDLAFTVNSAVTLTKSFDLTIDNMVDSNRFFNNPTTNKPLPQDRHVTLNAVLPYGDANALYGLGSAGTSCSATFTNGGSVLSLVAGKAVFMRKPINVPGRSEILMPFPGEFFKSGATSALTVTMTVGP